MSNTALNWAWAAQCRTHTQKLVLVALADRWREETGICFPSIPTLAAQCCLSLNGAAAQIAALEGDGWLVVQRTNGKSNRYTLSFPRGRETPLTPPRGGVLPPHAVDPPTPLTPPRGGVLPPHAVGDTPPRHRSVTQREPKVEPKHSEFDLFWNIFPRRVGKQKARQEWDKAKITFAEVEKQVLAWAKSEQWTKDGGKFCPHPATWLHQRRWEDDIPLVEPERKEWSNPNPRSFIPANLHLRGKYCNALRAQLAEGDESVRETLLKLRTANAEWIASQTPSTAEIARAKAYFDSAESIEEVEYAMFLNPDLVPDFQNELPA